MNDTTELTEEDIYEFLKAECAELIEQYEKLRSENEREFRSTLDAHNEATESENCLRQAVDYFHNGDLSLPQNLNSKEDIERYKDKLLEEKKILETQFIDVNIEIQRKKRQVEDFHNELANTKKNIQIVEQKMADKEKAIQVLEDHIEKFKQM